MRFFKLVLFASAIVLGIGCLGGDGPDTIVDDAGIDSGFPTGNCKQDIDTVGAEIERILAGASRTCDRDEDCTLVDRSVPCRAICAASVNLADAEQVESQIRSYGSSVCPLVGCTGSVDCLPFQEAICHEGICRHGDSDGGLVF
jgi:hypothetical protein